MRDGYINIELDLFDYTKRFKVSREKMIKAYQHPRIQELLNKKQLLIELGLPISSGENLFELYQINIDKSIGRLNYIDFKNNLADVTVKKEYADHINYYISLVCMESKSDNTFNIVKPVLAMKNCEVVLNHNDYRKR
jgi:hypothetical protein